MAHEYYEYPKNLGVHQKRGGMIRAKGGMIRADCTNKWLQIKTTCLLKLLFWYISITNKKYGKASNFCNDLYSVHWRDNYIINFEWDYYLLIIAWSNVIAAWSKPTNNQSVSFLCVINNIWQC